jgi:hypothetical protein
MMSWRMVFFGLICVVCTAFPLLYVLRAMRASEAQFSSAPVAPAPVAATPTPPAIGGANERDHTPHPPSSPSASLPRSEPPAASREIIYRYTGVDSGHGRLAHGDLRTPNEVPLLTELSCDRVHMVRDAGVCLTAQRRRFPVKYGAILFGGDFRARHMIPLTGVPSRAKVSPDGRLAAVTVFESGHSYSAGSFSTRTSILNIASGDFVIPDLEKLLVLRDGEPFSGLDFNFWGVTFAPDSNRFYATLATGGRIHFVEGDVANKRMRVLRQDVECPSLSPDGTRVAYKRREGGAVTAVTWRLSVARVDTLEDWTLAETRSVDDQVEWLDDATVLYSLPEAASDTPVQNTWAVPADGSGAPRLVVPRAYSLVVLRDRGERVPPARHP